jgi:hypothetical protein
LVLATKIRKLCEKIGFDGVFYEREWLMKGSKRTCCVASLMLKEDVFWQKWINEKKHTGGAK